MHVSACAVVCKDVVVSVVCAAWAREMEGEEGETISGEG